MQYLAMALLIIDVALGYTVYRQDKFLDELSDRLYDAENAIEPIDTEWAKEMRNDNR